MRIEEDETMLPQLFGFVLAAFAGAAQVSSY
jgi:hypothetical protein